MFSMLANAQSSHLYLRSDNLFLLRQLALTLGRYLLLRWPLTRNPLPSFPDEVNPIY